MTCPCGAPAGWRVGTSGGSWTVSWDSERPGPWCFHCAVAKMIAYNTERAERDYQLALL